MIQTIPFTRGGVEYAAKFGKDEHGYLIKVERLTPDEFDMRCAWYFSFLQTVADNDGYLTPFANKFRKVYISANGKEIPNEKARHEESGGFTNAPDFEQFMQQLFSSFAPSVLNYLIRAELDFDQQPLFVKNADGTVTVNSLDNGTPAIPGAYEAHGVTPTAHDPAQPTV